MPQGWGWYPAVLEADTQEPDWAQVGNMALYPAVPGADRMLPDSAQYPAALAADYRYLHYCRSHYDFPHGVGDDASDAASYPVALAVVDSILPGSGWYLEPVAENKDKSGPS